MQRILHNMLYFINTIKLRTVIKTPEWDGPISPPREPLLRGLYYYNNYDYSLIVGQLL